MCACMYLVTSYYILKYKQICLKNLIIEALIVLKNNHNI